MFERILEKINEKYSLEEIQEIINDDENYEQNIEELVSRIKNGESKESIVEEISKTIDNDLLKEIIIKSIVQELASYELTSFLREMTQEEFKKKIDSAFRYLYTDKDLYNLPDYFGDDDYKKFNILEKVLDTVNNIIIVDNYTFKTFDHICNDMFGFNREHTKFLWDLFKRNENLLFKNTIIKKLKNIESSINKFSNTLVELFDDEE